MKKILLPLIFLTSLTSYASVSEIKEKMNACYEKAESNLDSKICASEALDQADKELNEVYGKIVSDLKTLIAQEKKDNLSGMELMGEETLRRLVKSEKDWINFRDSNCSYRAAVMLNGSGESLIVIGCHAQMTLDRITELLSQ